MAVKQALGSSSRSSFRFFRKVIVLAPRLSGRYVVRYGAFTLHRNPSIALPHHRCLVARLSLFCSLKL